MSQISDWRTAKVLSLQRLRQIDIFVHRCRFAISTLKNLADKDTAGLELDSANQAECLRSRYNPITLLWFLHINQTKSNLSHLLILIEIIFNSKNYSWEVQFCRHDNTSNVISMSQISDWRTAKVSSLQRLRRIDICALVQICNYFEKICRQRHC